MYLPYLRGKQFELIALRELLENKLIGKNVLPIIEPTKLSSTLTKTIEQFSTRERLISVIRNPKVGNFTNEIENINNDNTAEKFIELLMNQYVVSALITNENTDLELKELLETGIRKEDIILIYNNRDYLDVNSQSFDDVQPKYNLTPDESAYRRIIKHNRILYYDKFAKKTKNTDYSFDEDEFFSEDHLYYKNDGYKGFSDYSIVGSDYSESGFAPYAVAIHIVYFDKKNNLRIRHFVSDSNSDVKDPAGKFGEALAKLISWNETMELDTYGIRQLVNHYRYGTYPGLGTVKKLSIMHHIELMSNFLDGV
jgi:ribosomal protein L17